MKHFKIRCSQIGKIMTNPRSKTEYYFAGAEISAQKYNKLIDAAIKGGDYEPLSKLETRKVDVKDDDLSDTVKTYVQTVRKEEIYKRKEEIYSKYMDKGIQMEQDAIDLAAQHMGWGLVFKNEQHFENTYMTGTPDIILADTVPDIKCAWSCFTFPLFDEKPNKDNWWQVQGYMDLTGKNKAQVIYCLMDLPENLLEDELYYAMKRNGMIDLEAEQEQAVRAYHSYNDVATKNRVKVFDIVRDDGAIKSIYERVEQCREYYLTLI